VVQSGFDHCAQSAPIDAAPQRLWRTLRRDGRRNGRTPEHFSPISLSDNEP
jgi:hypothetical protein